MSQTLACPNCGAAIEYLGSGHSVRCAYCRSTVVVPDALWQPIEHAQAIGQWKTYILVFLVVTLVLPTCASILATVLGVGGGILAAFAPFILRMFGAN